MILTVDCKNENFEIACNRIYFYIDQIKNSLDDIKITNKHFSTNDLAVRVCEKLNRGFSKRKMSSIIDPLLNILISTDSNITFGRNKFCEYNSQTDKYHIVSPYYYRIINDIKEAIKLYSQEHLKLVQRISIEDGTRGVQGEKKMRSDRLLIAVQIMELFNLINYNFQAGSRPEYFIRVNSPTAIRKVIEQENYQSRTLSIINDLHYTSVSYMKHFFEKLKLIKKGGISLKIIF